MSDTRTTRAGGTCAIIGAGLGGIALVANLGLLGYRLRLHDLDDGRLAKVRERGGLEVDGLVQGFAPARAGHARIWPRRWTAPTSSSWSRAAPSTRTSRAPSPRRSAMARRSSSSRAAPAARSSSVRSWRAPAAARRVDVAEMDNFPYSLAWPEPARVRMTIVKRFLQIAALPAGRVGRRARRAAPGVPAGRGRPEHPCHRPDQHERGPPRGEHGGQRRPPGGKRQRVSLLR